MNATETVVTTQEAEKNSQSVKSSLESPSRTLRNAERKAPEIPRPVDLTPTASCVLDVIRSLAAIAVMLGHCRGLYFVEYEAISPSTNNIFVKAIYYLTGFGHQSVMVFFVMSGLFITSSILRNYRRGWSLRDYVIDRGVRLYVVLIPGLLLGGLWDLIGVKYFNSSELYSSALANFGSGTALERLNMTSFIGNALFLQTRFASVFGSNGPLWSLFNEFWYYVLFPALLGAVLAMRRRSVSVLLYGAVAGVAAWVLGGAMVGFVVWLTGGVVALTSRHFRFSQSNRWSAGLYILLAAGLCATCLAAARTGQGWLGSDLAVGFSFAILTHGIVQLRIQFSKTALQLAKELAGFSYSLYLLHFPLLLLVRAIWLPNLKWQPDLKHLFFAGCVAALALFYSFAVSRVTEHKTSEVRAWVRRLLIPTEELTVKNA
jgi:peptidoglycan/LPS O-acetylase OafA/YrhL